MARLTPIFLVFLAALYSSPARPCSVYPGCVKTFPSGGEVPANLPALTWTYGLGTYVTPADQLPEPTVTEVLGDGAEQELPITIERGAPNVIRFGRTLTPGATYRIAISHGCSRRVNAGAPLDIHTTVLVAGPEAPIPSTLGSIDVSVATRGMRMPWTSSGTCVHEANVVTRDLILELSDEAFPWRRALVLTWSSASGLADVDWYEDLAVERAEADEWLQSIEMSPYHVCTTDDPGQEEGMSEGEHAATVHATIPGSDDIIASSRAVFDLTCDSSPDESLGGGSGEPGQCSFGAVDGVAMGCLVLVLLARRRLTSR